MVCHFNVERERERERFIIQERFMEYIKLLHLSHPKNSAAKTHYIHV